MCSMFWLMWVTNSRVRANSCGFGGKCHAQESVQKFTENNLFSVVVGGPPLGPQPANITCPSCRAQIQTRVTHESSSKTHIVALLLCLFVCWPCVCLPYCMDSCQTANHHCPACGSFLGSFKN